MGWLVAACFVLACAVAWQAERISRARRSARAAAEEARQLLEACPEALLLVGPDGRVRQMNAAVVRLFGFSRRELEGSEAERLFAETSVARYRDESQDFFARPRPLSDPAGEPFRVRHRAGERETPVELSWSAVESNGETLAAIAFHDVTDRQLAVEALRESEGRNRILLDDVLDSSAVAVCILDARLRVVWVNRAYESYFGVARAEVVGMDARRLVADRLRYIVEDHRDFGEKLLAAYDNNTYLEHFECRVVAGEGRDAAWLEHWSQPIEAGLYQGGRIESYSNVTERREAENRTRLFARIARNMQIGLLVYRMDDLEDDRSLRVLTVNPEGERLLGVSSDQILGRAIDEAFPQLREAGIPQLFAKVLRTNTARELEDFDYGDKRVLRNAWSFKAFPLPDQCVGIVFESITERKRAEQRFQDLAEGVAGDTGEAFFVSLVRYLARSLDLEFAMVGALPTPDATSIRTLALWSDGELAPNITYDLEGAPCHNVVGRAPCCYPDRVAELFPDDHLLQEMKVESYVGSPLFDSNGNPLGLIAVLGRRPLTDPQTATAVLRIFAARAAAELERLSIAELVGRTT